MTDARPKVLDTVPFAAGIALLLVGAALPAQPDTGPQLANLQSWEGRVADGKENLHRVIAALIDVVRDEKRMPEERHKGIELLAKSGDAEAYQFLTDNISLSLKPAARFDQGTLAPCFDELRFAGLTDWNVSKAVLASLDKPRTGEDVARYKTTLEISLGHFLALQVIEDELGKRPDGARKANLDLMKNAFGP